MRSIYFSLLMVASVIPDSRSASYFDNMSLRLTYLDRFDIEDKEEGLKEPSGLTLSYERDALWTVSDDTKKVFKLSLDGKLQKDESFKIAEEGLEGITLDPGGEFLFMVKEEGNEIIKLDLKTREVTDRKPLSGMAGYETIAPHFENSPPNKGLEGITWNTDTGSIFVVKEGKPGLLIEVSPDLATIQNHVLLSEENGFIDSEAPGDTLDFSGICYDRDRKCFWIVSDKGRRLFLYDWGGNRVIQSFALGYSIKGKYREIEKAEGIAIDPGSNRLFVVSDKEARLYVFAIEG